jgi:hypothetical protein
MGDLVELLPVDEEDETNQRVVELRVGGASIRSFAQQLGLPHHEVKRRLDRGLPVIDAAFKRRAIACSLLRLDELVETYHKLAKTGDVEAGNLMVRLECERRALLGLGGTGYDPTQLVAVGRDREKSIDAWMRGIEHILSRRADGEAEQLSEKR